MLSAYWGRFDDWMISGRRRRIALAVDWLVMLYLWPVGFFASGMSWYEAIGYALVGYVALVGVHLTIWRLAWGPDR